MAIIILSGAKTHTLPDLTLPCSALLCFNENISEVYITFKPHQLLWDDQY